MNELKLPQSPSERQHAHERLITQFFSKTDLLLPPPSMIKEDFLSHLITEYKENTNLPSKFNTKYGLITNPVSYLKSAKSETWELEGVMHFYFNYWFLKRSKELKEKTKTSRHGCGLDYGIISSTSPVLRDGQIWFDIKLEVGPFIDWDDYLGALPSVYSNLQDTVLRILEHPDLLDCILKEREREEIDT